MTEKALLLQSADFARGRFDPDYYQSCYSEEIAPGQDALDHFLSVGADAGLKPCEDFDPILYKIAHPDRGGVNPLFDCLRRGDRTRYDHPGKIFPEHKTRDGTVGAVTIPLPPDVRQQCRRNGHLIAENRDRSILIPWRGATYELRNPSLQTVLNRFANNQPFSFGRLPHGFWDSLLRWHRLVEELGTHPLCPNLNRSEIGNLASRLLSSEYMYHTLMANGVFSEHFVEEALADMRSNPRDEDFWTAIAFKPFPTPVDSALGFEDDRLAHRLELFDDYFTPADRLYDANLMKRWVISGDISVFAQGTLPHPTILVGPARLGDLGAQWGHGDFHHIGIPPAMSQVLRYQLLETIAAAVAAISPANGGAKPIVLFQCGGSLAYWFIRRLRLRAPDVFYIDMGQSLNVWAWDPPTAWMSLFSEQILAVNPFIVQS